MANKPVKKPVVVAPIDTPPVVDAMATMNPPVPMVAEEVIIKEVAEVLGAEVVSDAPQQATPPTRISRTTHDNNRFGKA